MGLPLDGVRVLDLSRLLPGGLCTVVLADLGADVIKVEAPPRGDYARAREPHHESSDPSTSSATFIGLNRNKRSMVLDMKAPAGAETLLRLVATSDVVLESFRPGVLARNGVGYDAMRAVNPKIVLCSISGWGQQGPTSQVAGHDINYLAELGLLSMTGTSAEEPVLSSMQVADSVGGLLSATVILAALREADASGTGQHIDVSMAHGSLLLAAMTVASTLATGTVLSRAEGLWSGGVTCYQTYRCADGWVALGALEEKFWRAFCLGIDRPDLIEHRYDATGSPVHTDVAEIFAGGSRAQWSTFAARHDCCLTVVRGLSDALSSPVVREAGIIEEFDQPGIAEPVATLTLPVGLSKTPVGSPRRPAPSLGAHTREILREAGLSDAEVNARFKSGTVA